jgi:hypothetical protein
MKMVDVHVALAGAVLCMGTAAFLVPVLAPVTAAAQRSGSKAAVPSQSADSSKNAKPQTSGQVEVTKVEFLAEYTMCGFVLRPKPTGDMIVVVQTNIREDPFNSAWGKLDNYAFEYTTAASGTGSSPSGAVGYQYTLTNGQNWNFWHTGGGVRDCVGAPPSREVGRIIVVGVLPKNATSFKLSVRNVADIPLVSGPIQHDTGKGSPSAK